MNTTIVTENGRDRVKGNSFYDRKFMCNVSERKESFSNKIDFENGSELACGVGVCRLSRAPSLQADKS